MLVKKESWGGLIGPGSPNADNAEEGDIWGKIFESLGEDLAGEAGYTNLINWLNKQDDNASLIDSIGQFMKLVKKPNMSVTEYLLASLDTAYNTSIKKGLDKLQQPYLKYLKMENAGLID